MNDLCSSLKNMGFEVGVDMPIASATKENSLHIMIMDHIKSYSYFNFTNRLSESHSLLSLVKGFKIVAFKTSLKHQLIH